MKTTLAILITGLIFLALPMLATAGSNHHQRNHNRQQEWVRYDRNDNHHYKRERNHRYECKQHHRGNRHLRRELRETRRELRQIKRHHKPERQQQYRPHTNRYSNHAIVISLPPLPPFPPFPHQIFKFKW